MIKNKISVGIVGLGMVGDPIRRWFEEVKGYKRGKDIYCFDVDSRKGYGDDVNKADIIFVSVPTPTKKNAGSDTSIVHQAVSTIKDGKTIVIKSTIPPGTIEGLQKEFPKKKFIFNPEFLTESQVWSDFIRTDRQILGPSAKGRVDVKEVQNLLPMAPFSRPWSSDYSKKEVTATEAELVKYASNAFGYTKVIYGNILADICHALNQVYKQEKISSVVDYDNLREMLGSDPRIGPAWLDVSHGKYSGAGGFCFPKDMNAMISFINHDLITPLSKSKKTDKQMLKVLKKGVGVLEAVRDYNRELLISQGLTEEGISCHSKDIDTSKVKSIRV